MYALTLSTQSQFTCKEKYSKADRKKIDSIPRALEYMYFPYSDSLVLFSCLWFRAAGPALAYLDEISVNVH